MTPVSGPTPPVDEATQTTRTYSAFHRRRLRNHAHMVPVKERVDKVANTYFVTPLCKHQVYVIDTLRDWRDNRTSELPLTNNGQDVPSQWDLDQVAGGMVCAHMGLMKTYAVLARVFMSGGFVLIVAPQVVMETWHNEADNHCRNSKRDFPIWYYDSKISPPENLITLRNHITMHRSRCGAIVSHTMFRLHIDSIFNSKLLLDLCRGGLAGPKIERTLVVDEVDHARDPTKQLSQCIARYKCDQRILITGTPFHNNKDTEFLSYAKMLNIVPPTFSFATRHETRKQQVEMVREYVARRMLVFSLADANIILPACRYHYKLVEMYHDEKVLYSWVSNRMKRVIAMSREIVKEMTEELKSRTVRSFVGQFVLCELVLLRQAAVDARIMRAKSVLQTPEAIADRLRSAIRIAIYRQSVEPDAPTGTGKRRRSVSPNQKASKKARLRISWPSVFGNTLDPEDDDDMFLMRGEGAGAKGGGGGKKSAQQKRKKKRLATLGDVGISAAEARRRGCEDPPDASELAFKIPQRSSSVDMAVDMIRSFARAGHKTVVFAEWHGVLDYLGEALREANLNFRRLDGTMKREEKSVPISDFQNNPDVCAIIATTKTGSHGIQLTSGSKVIFMQPWFNPEIERQSWTRVHRPGQTKVTDVFWLICDNTYEVIVHIIASVKAHANDRNLDRKTNDYNFAESTDGRKLSEIKRDLEQRLEQSTLFANVGKRHEDLILDAYKASIETRDPQMCGTFVEITMDLERMAREKVDE